MSLAFEELDWARTPIGDVSLRRRQDPVTREIVFEVLLGDEYLMSSMFTAAEIALTRLALARARGDGLVVAVGGLGLGYTALAALADERVTELVVVELLKPVISWHRQGLVPAGPTITADTRCRLIQADFFDLCKGPGFDPAQPNRLFHAVLLDIDHSPSHVLADGSVDFYGIEGMGWLARHLLPGGVFALWSNDPPDEAYVAVLEQVFTDVVAEVVRFPNPLQGGESSNTVYVASKG